MKRILVAVLLVSSAQAQSGGSVVGSKHDLSTTGPGPIRAVSEGNACVFCHIPHEALPGALSNRPSPTAVYVPYESTTMSARPGAPTGTSRICLSCHDGTIAVGKTHTRDVETTGGAIAPGRRSYIGTDLRNSHPVSFAPAPSQKTRRPAAGDAVKHDRSGQVQCTSCHDPHREWLDPLVGKFLVKPSGRSQLCLSCHVSVVAGAPDGSHATAAAQFGVREGNALGYPSVADAGCGACHRPHHGDGKGRLLERPTDDDDATCLRCHGSPVTKANIGAELSKRSAHVARGVGVHDAAEGRPAAARALPETSAAAKRHVTCVDCHDPHRATGRAAVPPGVGGPLDGMWGVDRGGQRVEQVQFHYELCFKCHGDSANQPAGVNPTSPRRAAGEGNLRLAFAADAISAHPVVAPSRGGPVPSLKAPYVAGATISCVDCHASDAGPGAGGTGPRGPHGSVYPSLLERNYLTADYTQESPQAYALCYKCHDRQVLLSSSSSFGEHARHLSSRVAAPCSACHSPHGVSARSGTPGANTRLIDFDTTIVSPLGGIRRFTPDGPGRGSCTLMCHGKEHDRRGY